MWIRKEGSYSKPREYLQQFKLIQANITASLEKLQELKVVFCTVFCLCFCFLVLFAKIGNGENKFQICDSH